MPSPLSSNQDLFNMTFALVMKKLIKLHEQNKHDQIQITLCKAEGRNFCLSDNPVMSRHSLDAHMEFDFNHLLPISPNLALMFNNVDELKGKTEIRKHMDINHN